VIAAIPDAVTNLAVAHWRSRREFRRCLHLNLVMATTCLVLTWFWLPGLGIAAAGLAWLVGEFAGALLIVVQRPRRRLVVRQRTKKTGNRRRPPTRRKEAAVR
jgi:Na+-driven multidrug efflux pump